LPANTMGDAAYSACFVALTYNGLVLAGDSGELMLVRPETRPGLTAPKRPWSRDRILSTRLYHLGYLNSDHVLRHYHDNVGTGAGHAILQPRSNTLIVVDSDSALEELGAFIDTETMEAMGVASSGGFDGERERRRPSAGAMAAREGVHFYLLAFAR